MRVFDDWPDILLAGSYSATLAELRLSRAGRSVAGAGIVTWTQEAGHRLQAATSRESIAFADLLGGEDVGRLAADSDLWRLEGLVEGTWKVSGHVFQGVTIDERANHLLWDSEIIKLEASRSSEVDGPAWLEVLLQPFAMRIWPRVTKYWDDNPHFMRRGVSRDWFEVRGATEWQIACRRLDEQSATVRVHGTLVEADNIWQTVRAIELALTFVTGRRVRSVGFRHRRRATDSCVTLPRWPSIDNPWHHLFDDSVISYDGNRVETGIAKAVDFYYSDHGNDCAFYLDMAMVANDLPVETRALAYAIAVEGLAETIAKQRNELVPDASNADRVKRLRQHLRTQEAEYGRDFIRRVCGALSRLAHPRTQDLLEQWSRAAGSLFAKEEIDAWKRIRNPAAHGDLLDLAGEPTSSQRQAIAHQLRLLQNMINKLQLLAMGYDGDFVDWVEPRGRVRRLAP